MSARISSYQVVLPRPWVRVPVRQGTRERVAQVVAGVVARAPKEVPPDQLKPWARELERRLTADVEAAREYGGIDFYLPSNTWHGFLVGASFVVSEISPPGLMPEEPTSAVAGLLAEMLRDPEARPVAVADTTWVRSERVVAPNQDRAELDTGTRRVTWSTPVPDDPERWVVSAFSCTGDGDPHGELALLTTQLFDAIMGTWRWIREETDPVAPTDSDEEVG